LNKRIGVDLDLRLRGWQATFNALKSLSRLILRAATYRSCRAAIAAII